MKKLLLSAICLAISAPSVAGSYFKSDVTDFKRYSVSVGWLGIHPTDKTNPVHVETTIKDNYLLSLNDDNPPKVESSLAASGLGQWTQAGTGVTANNTNAFGILVDYYFTDNISLQLIGGIPPKVDLKGEGKIVAPLTLGLPAEISDPDNPPQSIGIPITDLSKPGKLGSARSWNPATTIQYHFGQTGKDKFRPYIGIGAALNFFNEIKLDKGVEADLVTAGHRIAWVETHSAGNALNGLNDILLGGTIPDSGRSPHVKLKATSSIAPFATIGGTFDVNDSWFVTGSLSYMPLSTKAKILVMDGVDGHELIRSEVKIKLDPVISYLGVGYRF